MNKQGFMEKVFIIAKYATPDALEAFDCGDRHFTLADSIFETFTGKECNVQRYYHIEQRAFAEKVLMVCNEMNPSVGYAIVEIDI